MNTEMHNGQLHTLRYSKITHS